MDMKSSNGKLCAIIPVRAGSKRVPHKNTRAFGNSNLLLRKVFQVGNAVGFENVYVSTDCPTAKAMLETRGVNILDRPEEFANDTVSMSEVYKHLAEQVDADHILFTHVTNPLCDTADYIRAIRAYDGIREDYPFWTNVVENKYVNDSITTVSLVKEFLLDPEGTPVNFDEKNKPRSQDLPNYMKLNHAISILPRETMIARKSILGYRPVYLQLSAMSSLDVDTELDFKIAEYVALNADRL